jgi:23S rRNA pseudouridine1911/1915/1917 synthase
MHNTNTPSGEDTLQTLSIGEEAVGLRLDRYLSAFLTEISRTTIQQLISEKTILVNGKNSKPGYVLRLNDTVQLPEQPAPQRVSNAPVPLEAPLDIVYEDDDLLVVNKAPGMVVHPAPGHHDDTLVNALVSYRPELQGIGGEERPGIVHRLDKDTSGLLIVAKNTRTLAKLTEEMKEHHITKRYIALTDGIVSLDQGSIDAPIGRDPRYRQQMKITAIGSREAVTHFKVLKRFQRHTLLLLQLETGRTHQIRVHLKAIGHPVVGDPVYGSKKILKDIPLTRQFLHAYQLEFKHPNTATLLQLEAPLPADLQNVLDQETVL